MYIVSEPIRSVVARVATDKPVRKTSYQVKGVIMNDFPDEEIIPFINGSYRSQFLYPRVQVKILNEQIYLVGIKEGVDPILSVVEKLKTMNFGNITFEVEGSDADVEEDHFVPSPRMIRYRFLTPWVALNEINLGKYKFVYGDERPKFLNRLLSQNIAFLAKEMEMKLETKVYVKLTLESLYPKLVDDGHMGAFEGEFKTNFVLPNFLGIGNGITKGYGVLFSHFNPADFQFDESELKSETSNNQAVEDLPPNWEEDAIDPDDVPKSRRIVKSRKEAEEHNYNTRKYHKRSH